MDLLESRTATQRHPWELARARAVERIVRRHQPRGVTSILDWGCGDAFTGRFLLDRLAARTLVGVDPNLTEAERANLTDGDGRVRLFREERALPSERFDLVLLCDVIEHVADDVELVERVTRTYLADGGRVVVTVPAFQSLFSAHDVALKHYRRYRLSELDGVLDRSGLDVLGSGYLFGSLLPARALTKLLEGKTPRAADEGVGVGAWRGGAAVSKAFETLLRLDNSILLGLAEHGLRAPGLSVWASCERRTEY